MTSGYFSPSSVLSTHQKINLAFCTVSAPFKCGCVDKIDNGVGLNYGTGSAYHTVKRTCIHRSLSRTFFNLKK